MEVREIRECLERIQSRLVVGLGELNAVARQIAALDLELAALEKAAREAARIVESPRDAAESEGDAGR